MSFVFVALGGALGAVSRYAISLIPVKTQFPVLTLVTNILGAILIGFIVGMADKKEDVSPNMLLFWKTGVCGGFTTFSTFSLEAYKLFEDHAYAAGGAYVALSVCCCILGIFLGKKLSAVIGQNGMLGQILLLVYVPTAVVMIIGDIIVWHINKKKKFLC